MVVLVTIKEKQDAHSAMANTYAHTRSYTQRNGTKKLIDTHPRYDAIGGRRGEGVDQVYARIDFVVTFI